MHYAPEFQVINGDFHTLRTVIKVTLHGVMTASIMPWYPRMLDELAMALESRDRLEAWAA